MGVGSEGNEFLPFGRRDSKVFMDIEKSWEYINIEICPRHLHKLSAIVNDLVFHSVQFVNSAFKQTLFLEISKMSSDMHDAF